MRKGKEFCEYVSWRKEKIDQIVINKLRTALLPLILDNQLEEEIHKYHHEMHKHTSHLMSTLETEIRFLRNKVQTMQVDIDSGSAKAFYSDLIIDMKAELSEKESEHATVSNGYQPLHTESTELQLIHHDMKLLISLLDDEVPNPGLLNQLVSKYISRVIVQRETKTAHISFNIKQNEIVLYQKTIVAEWDSYM